MITAVNFQIKQLESKSLKIRASKGFEPVTSANTGAMLCQLSYESKKANAQFTQLTVQDNSRLTL